MSGHPSTVLGRFRALWASAACPGVVFATHKRLVEITGQSPLCGRDLSEPQPHGLVSAVSHTEPACGVLAGYSPVIPGCVAVNSTV